MRRKWCIRARSNGHQGVYPFGPCSSKARDDEGGSEALHLSCCVGPGCVAFWTCQEVGKLATGLTCSSQLYRDCKAPKDGESPRPALQERTDKTRLSRAFGKLLPQLNKIRDLHWKSGHQKQNRNKQVSSNQPTNQPTKQTNQQTLKFRWGATFSENRKVQRQQSL